MYSAGQRQPDAARRGRRALRQGVLPGAAAGARGAPPEPRLQPQAADRAAQAGAAGDERQAEADAGEEGAAGRAGPGREPRPGARRPAGVPALPDRQGRGQRRGAAAQRVRPGALRELHLLQGVPAGDGADPAPGGEAGPQGPAGRAGGGRGGGAGHHQQPGRGGRRGGGRPHAEADLR